MFAISIDRYAHTMALIDHEFGGVSTDLKLSLVAGYLHAFTTALRGKFSELWYIDGFAGTGERTVRHAAKKGDLFDPATEERIEHLRGSAQIAIDVTPPFDRLIFMDINKKHCKALRELRLKYPERQFHVLEGNANEAIQRVLRNRSWTNVRGVMFLDPYGMSVNWETLGSIRATEVIDVWYLFSLSGLFRQAALDLGAMDRSKHAAITRVLGTDEWETAFYRKTERIELFGQIEEERSRVVDVKAMEDFVWSRLSTLFPKVLKPFRLKDDRGIS
jgi:three-Cys-motif partner protein